MGEIQVMRTFRLFLIAILGLVVFLAACNAPATDADSAAEAGDGEAADNEAAESAASKPAAKPKPKPVTLPSGTELEVVLLTGLSSKENTDSDPFEGTLNQDVVIDGKTVLPKDAKVAGVVTKAKKSGRLKGRAELWVTLTSVSHNGRSYTLSTDVVGHKEGSKTKKNVLFIGGGAGAGAAVGAIAGGGKGAAAGGAIGAAAGTAGALLTGKKNIKFPAETVLLFALEESVSIRR